MDRTISYASPYANPGQADQTIEYYKDMKCHTVQWDDQNANAGANLRNGHVWLFAIAVQSTVNAGVPTFATTDPPHIRYTSRIRFQDN